MKSLVAFAAFAGCTLSSSFFLARPLAGADAVIQPIVDAQYGYLLGGSKNGRWIGDKETAKAIKGNETYRVYGLSTRLGMTTGSDTRTDEAPCSETHWVRLQKNFNGVLALGGNWNAAPRRTRVQNVNQRIYRNAVASYLRSHGLRNPKVVIAQLWRVDLEGDGREEVLLCATNYKGQKAGPMNISANASAGDYSIVLLRKVTGSRVTTIPLAAEIYPRNKTFVAPNEHRLAGVLDANGDGKMEIVLRSRYYEGDAVTLIEVNGTQTREVLSAGCGA
jgi:hypothetical protein